MRKLLKPLQFPPLPGRLAEATVYFIENLGSEQTDHRLQLRALFAEQLAVSGFSPPQNITTLDKPLTHSELHLSLSHTVDASGIAWVKNSLRVGVDVEQLQRLQPHIIERVSLLAERTNAPDIRYLWPAKEASFKALSPRCQVISDIEIHSWNVLSPTISAFKARLSSSDQRIDGSGLVCLISGHLLAFFVCEH